MMSYFSRAYPNIVNTVVEDLIHVDLYDSLMMHLGMP